jgi:hypothetical protein
LFIAATVAFGLFVGSFFRTRERAFQYIIATSIPLFFLANLSWPAVMTPQPLVWLAQLLPTTSGINLMVRLNQMDASLAEVSHELITLTVLLLLYGSLATWRLLAKRGRRGLSRKRPAGLRHPLRPLFRTKNVRVLRCGRGKRGRRRSISVDAFAAALDHAVAVLLLAVALDLAARRTTGNGTGHGSELLPLPPPTWLPSRPPITAPVAVPAMRFGSRELRCTSTFLQTTRLPSLNRRPSSRGP